MPVAVVVSTAGAMPAIFSEPDDAALVARLGSVRDAPALDGPDGARAWLARMPWPSGWYASTDDALARIRQVTLVEPMTGAEVAAARSALGLSRAAFASAIGFGGNDNTRHKHVWQVERGDIQLSLEATRRLRAVLAERQIAPVPARTK